jgi:hypothetical protein
VSRIDFNEAATSYNVLVKRFPGKLVAMLFGFEASPLFESDEGSEDAPEVDFSFGNSEEKEENDTDLIYPFTCKDDDGVPFTLSIITRKSQNNRKQLYLNHKNFIVVYNIVNYSEKGER